MQRSDDAARVTDPTAAGAPATCLRRQMGLGTATAVVVASMIGQMIFTSSGFLANDL